MLLSTGGTLGVKCHPIKWGPLENYRSRSYICRALQARLHAHKQGTKRALSPFISWGLMSFDSDFLAKFKGVSKICSACKWEKSWIKNPNGFADSHTWWAEAVCGVIVCQEKLISRRVREFAAVGNLIFSLSQVISEDFLQNKVSF